MDRELLAWLISFLDRCAAKTMIDSQTAVGQPHSRSLDTTFSNLQRCTHGLSNFLDAYPAFDAIKEMLEAKYAVEKEQEESLRNDVLLINHNAPSWGRYERATAAVEILMALDTVADLATVKL